MSVGDSDPPSILRADAAGRVEGIEWTYRGVAAAAVASSHGRENA